MKKLFGLVLCGLLMFFVSCEEDELADQRMAVDGSPANVSTLYVMNSRENTGFSVASLKLADFPKTEADFIIIPQTSLTGDVMSPFLSNPDLEKRFMLTDEFDDGKSAEAFYNSYNSYPELESLQQFALNLKANQVWLVKTGSDEFCKIWIIETRVDKKTSFVEIKFRAGRID